VIVYVHFGVEIGLFMRVANLAVPRISDLAMASWNYV
jgi:hypothetical protein